MRRDNMTRKQEIMNKKELIKNKMTNVLNLAKNRVRLDSDPESSSTDLQNPKTNFQQPPATTKYLHPNVQTCHSACFISKNELGYYIKWCFTLGGWMYCFLPEL